MPIKTNKTSQTLKVIQQLRDEAHRFGINFHRNKRSKEFISSELKTIEGIGEKTMQKLLKEFKSVKTIREQPLPVLEQSVGKSKAKIVFDHFNK